MEAAAVAADRGADHCLVLWAAARSAPTRRRRRCAAEVPRELCGTAHSSKALCADPGAPLEVGGDDTADPHPPLRRAGHRWGRNRAPSGGRASVRTGYWVGTRAARDAEVVGAPVVLRPH